MIVDSWLWRWQGERVFHCTWGNYLADLDDPAWRTWWSDQVMDELALNEDDGLFADSFSVPNYFGACSWRPCLPVVDAGFEADWARREHDFTEYMRSRFAGRWRWIPNIGSLITTRDPSDYGNVDGAMIEGFAESGGGGYYDESDWRLQLNRVLRLVRADKFVIAQTYPDPENVDERMFILGTYLLVRGDHTYLNMDIGQAPEWFPEYRIDVGASMTATPADIAELWRPDWGVYVRGFTRGMVIVNPSTEPRRIDLGREWPMWHPEGGGLVPADGSEPGSLTQVRVRVLTLPAHGAAAFWPPGPTPTPTP
jgi:hypothetical protein